MTIRTKLFLVPALLCGFASGCGSNTATVDMGGADDMAQAAAPDLGSAPSHHMSYVPAGLLPKDAARLIVLGDSISAGNGASAKTDAYAWLLDNNDDAKWPAEISTSLSKKFGHDVTLVNVSVPGATTTTMLSQFSTLDQRLGGPAQGHSVVAITIGGNDLQSAFVGGDPVGTTLTDALANISQAIDNLQDKTKFPDGTSIYLMAVYDPSDGQGTVSNTGPPGMENTCFFGISLPTFIPALNTWRDKYIDIGKQKGIAVVDALGAFHGHGFYYFDNTNEYYSNQDPTLWFAKDCLHPNDRGHSELRRLFFEAIDGKYVATP